MTFFLAAVGGAAVAIGGLLGLGWWLSEETEDQARAAEQRFHR